MTQPNQQNSTGQRTVLLAVGSNNSVIGEIVDGKAKVITYSAYGEQTASQPVETRLGFNGQLREMNIGWYLLGNGYRAFNPTLMRFHSPDSWSPFRRGGLNAYMYCVGDPVNRTDPTGHMSILKFLSKAYDFFSFNPQITGSNYSRAITATGAARGLAGPNGSGEFGGLLGIGAGIGSRAPGPGGRSSTPIGNSPALGEWGATTARNHPGYAAGAAGDGLTRRLSRSPQRSGAGYGGRRSSVYDAPTAYEHPPSYEESMPYWNADTIAAAHGPRTYVTYPASPSGPVTPAVNEPPFVGRAGPNSNSSNVYPEPTTTRQSERRWSGESGPSDWSSSSSSSRSSSPVQGASSLKQKSTSVRKKK
jgi:RHS repeat-associated protein